MDGGQTGACERAVFGLRMAWGAGIWGGSLRSAFLDLLTLVLCLLLSGRVEVGGGLGVVGRSTRYGLRRCLDNVWFVKTYVSVQGK